MWLYYGWKRREMQYKQADFNAEGRFRFLIDKKLVYDNLVERQQELQQKGR